MRRLSLIAAIVLVTIVGACSRQDGGQPLPGGPSLDGDWHGELPVPGHPLPIGLSIHGADGTVSSPAQGLKDFKLAEVGTEPGDVRFRMPGIPGDPAFHGAYEADTDTIVGQFSQSGATLPLTFARGVVPEPARPQEPKPPFPYQSRDVTFASGDVTIGGTLTTPAGPGPHPAVVLLSGSGAQNRDEELFGHKPFLVLADAFTRAGYAVLRTDDRGVGASTGKDADATYADLASDALAMTDFLRTQPAIDKTRIGLLGHSQGGSIAPLAAQREPGKVAFVILMAGPAQSGCDVIRFQNRDAMAGIGATPEQIETNDRQVLQICDRLKAGDLKGAKDVAWQANEQLPPERRKPRAVVEAQFTPVFTALVNYEPEAALRALRVPTLAFFGGKDVQVPARDNEPLMREYLMDDPAATVHTFPDANHLMQPAQKGTVDEYQHIETTIDPAVLDFVSGWMKTNIPNG